MCKGNAFLEAFLEMDDLIVAHRPIAVSPGPLFGKSLHSPC